MRLFLCLVALCLFLALGVGAAVPSLTSYALNGPHAYDVHWVKNSAVGFLLTNDGTGYHKLYRTDDKGLHWNIQTPYDPSGGACYVLRIYEDPLISQNIIFAGPPSASCGWSTTDAGLTYKYLTFPALVQSLSLNPNSSGHALARTQDSRVFLTKDSGSTWTQVNATQAAWAPAADTSAVSTDLYLIRDNSLYFSSNEGQSSSIVFEDMIELHATDNFVYATAVNRTLLVGQEIGNIQRAYFPFGDTIPYVFSVSDDSSGATWFYTDASYYWGNIYTAGESGALYVEKLQHVLKRSDAMLDVHSVHGLPGVHLANVVQNFNDYHDLQLKTYITFNNGGDWSPLKVPNACATCSLNLYFNYKTNQRAFYTSASTIGLILANGYPASSLSYDNPVGLNPYLSRDAGLNWEQLKPTTTGPHVFDFGQNGGILVMAPEDQLTSTISYSFDQGITFSTYQLPATVYITRIISQASSSVFVLFTINAQGNAIVYGIDFSPFKQDPCAQASYEEWAPSDPDNLGCWMGQTITYSRRIRNVICNDTRGELLLTSTNCECTKDDFECDFGFIPATDGSGTCTVAGALPPSPPVVCVKTYEKSQGFRLVPGDKCTGGVDLRPKVVACPKPESNGSGSRAWVAVVVILVILVVVAILGFIVYRDPTLRERVMSLVRPSRSSRYGRLGSARGRASSLAGEEDFGIHDDLLEEGGEEDAKVLHDHEISRASASSKSEEFSIRHSDDE